MIVCTDPASARISTLSLHDALPISVPLREFARAAAAGTDIRPDGGAPRMHGDPAGGRAGAALHPPQLPTPSASQHPAVADRRPPRPRGNRRPRAPAPGARSPAVEPWNRRRSTMSRHRYAVIAALAGLVALPGAGSAQQPTQRQIDSLAAQVRALKAQLDSLRAALGRGRKRRRLNSS